MIRIVVVDDHPVVREGLVAALARREDFTIVGVVSAPRRSCSRRASKRTSSCSTSSCPA